MMVSALVPDFCRWRWGGLLLALVQVFGLFSVTPYLQGAATMGGIRSDPRSKVDVEVTRFYDELPLQGYMPLRIRIINKSDRDHTYQLRTVSVGPANLRVEMDQDLLVEAGATQEFQVLAPLSPASLDPYVDVQCEVYLQGHGIANPREIMHDSAGSGSGVNSPLVLLSEEVTVSAVGRLQGVLQSSHGMELRRSTFQTDFLPVDWRGWLGADLVILTPLELEQFPPEAREALRQWIALGGNIMLTGTNTSTAELQTFWPEAQWENTNAGMLGFGKIRLEPQSGTQPAVEAMSDFILGAGDNYDRLLKNIVSGYGKDFGMTDVIKGVDLNAPIILVFMVAFAVLVGPVNLFVFARGNKRYRIFWTTPLISLATSGLLFVVILLQDGIGGKGTRMLVNVILPGQNEMVQVQEQVSRSGLLLNRSFEFDSSAAIFPVELGSFRSSYAMRSENSTLYNLDLVYNNGGSQLVGDWFRSRSRQGQLLMNIEPSRARVEFLGTEQGDPPKILSNINERLDLFYYHDGSQAWMARNVEPGTQVTLGKTSQPLVEIGVDYPELGGSWIKHHLVRRVDGRYYAAVVDAPGSEGFLETLNSIRWTKQHVLYFEFLPPPGAASGSTQTGETP